MATDTRDAKREALKRTAAYLAAAVRRVAPTARSAASFRVRQDREDLVIESHDEGTIHTVLASRHPLFGNKDRWYGPSGRQRGKKDFVSRSVDRAMRVAAEKFADEYVTQLVADSEIWSDE